MSFNAPITTKPNGGRRIIGALLLIVLIGGAASFLMSNSKGKARFAKHEEIISITLPPPPPPPPLPPPPPPKEVAPPEEPEMIEQEPVDDDEQPPDEAPLEAPPAIDLGPGTPGGSGPGIGGPGGGGNRIGGKRSGSGSRFGWYAAKVQSSIADALRRNASTRSATMTLQIRIWPDSNGRITRAQLIGSSGDAAVDQAIKNQILTGLQLPQAPPADMPTPIVLRINARKPSF